MKNPNILKGLYWDGLYNETNDCVMFLINHRLDTISNLQELDQIGRKQSDNASVYLIIVPELLSPIRDTKP